MRVVIDIPKDFARDYSADKFKDFFSRVIADIDNGSLLCGNYEKEIAEMFLKAFNDSFVDVLGVLNENYSRKSRAVFAYLTMATLCSHFFK